MKTGTKSRPLAKGLKTWWFPEFPDLPFLLLPLETAKSGKVLANEKAIFFYFVSLCASYLEKINQTKPKHSERFRFILSKNYVSYVNTICRDFKRGVQNWKDFCLKINIPKGNF